MPFEVYQRTRMSAQMPMAKVGKDGKYLRLNRLANELIAGFPYVVFQFDRATETASLDPVRRREGNAYTLQQNRDGGGATVYAEGFVEWAGIEHGALFVASWDTEDEVLLLTPTSTEGCPA